MVSSILHLCLALTTAVGAIATYALRKKDVSREKLLKKFSVFFTLFTFYHLFLALPFLLFKAEPCAMAWGYNLAIFMVFPIMIPIYKTMLSDILELNRRRINLWISFLLLAGLVAVTFQFYDFRPPLIDASGFIIWNGNFISGLIALSVVVLGMILWLVIYHKNLPSNLSLRVKIKTTLYTLSFLMFTISTVYFIAYWLILVYVAFITVTLGTIFLIIDFLIPKE